MALAGMWLAGATPALAAVGGQSHNGYVSGAGMDVRAYGAVCDGTTDDKLKIEAAYDALTTLGGTIIIPAGKTCMTSADIEVESNVALSCQPGGTIKITSGGTITLGMLSWYGGAVARNDAAVEGCSFDLNGKAKPAMFVVGARNPITRSKFYGGATSSGSNWIIVDYRCVGDGCTFDRNTITCANTSGAKDTGLSVYASTVDGEQSVVSGNQIKACDIAGISGAAGKVQIATNTVTVTGTSGVGIGSAVSDGTLEANTIVASGATAVGIDLTTTGLSAQSNRVTVSGTSGIGIRSTSTGALVTNNKITVSGASGTAIRTTSCCGMISGNSYSLTAVTGGTDNAIGIYVGDGSGVDENFVVVGNQGSVTTSDAQVHVVMAAPMVTVVGNIFTKGKYCVAPSQASAAEFSYAYNITISGNRCYAPATTGIIAVTGTSVTGNYIAWVSTGGTAAIEVGDDRTLKIGTGHTLIVGNLLHSNETGVAGVKSNAIGKTCDGGTKQYQACTNDNTTDCPGATCPSCCDTSVGLSGVQVTGNHMLMTAADHGAGVDLSGVSSTSGDIFNWVIAGNTIETSPGSVSVSSAAIKCSSSNQTKVHDIDIGINSYNGYSPVSGDTTEGRIDMNCTPDMVDDAGTQMVWLPAGGCVNTTAFSAFDLPTSSAPTATCGGTYQRRGSLSYPDASDTGGMVSFAFMQPNIVQFFVRPVYSVAAVNTLSTRWGFTMACLGDAEGVDVDWATLTETTMDTAYGNTSGAFEIPAAYSTMGGRACSGLKVGTLRVRRIGSNSTGGQDDQTSASLLYGVQLYIRKQD